jgi:hypothetical protein
MKRIAVLILLALALLQTSGLTVHSVLADQAVVQSIVFSTRPSDNHTILNISVLHHNYNPSHYVDVVNVDVAGSIRTVNPSTSQPVDQSFIVQYDLGVVTGTPTVLARANCIIHGSVGWSSPVAVPEFSTTTILASLAAMTLILFLFRSRL